MSLTSVKIGSGSLLLVGNGDGPPETYTKFAELKSLTPMKFTREAVDATHSESPDGYKEYVAGLKDGGEVAGDFNFVNDSKQASALTDFEAGTLRNFKITMPNGAVFVFAGIYTEYGPSAVDIRNPLMRALKIKVNGKVTVTQP